MALFNEQFMPVPMYGTLSKSFSKGGNHNTKGVNLINNQSFIIFRLYCFV